MPKNSNKMTKKFSWHKLQTERKASLTVSQINRKKLKKRYLKAKQLRDYIKLQATLIDLRRGESGNFWFFYEEINQSMHKSLFIGNAINNSDTKIEKKGFCKTLSTWRLRMDLSVI